MARGGVPGSCQGTGPDGHLALDPDGACLETFLSITDGIENTSDRQCTWTASSSTVTVTYAGVGGPFTFSMQYSFPEPERAPADADEFGRVG